MVSRQIIRPGQQDDIQPHTHHAIQITGKFNFLRVLNALVTGNMTVEGFIRTAVSGRRIEIRPDSGAGGVPSVQFFTDVVGEAAFFEVRDVGGGVEALLFDAPGSDNALVQVRDDQSVQINIDALEVLRVVAGQLRLIDGDAATPSLAARDDIDTGVFFGAGFVGFASGGTEVARFTGTAGQNLQGLEWTNWTPTLTGITVGNGTVVARYVQIGQTVHAHFMFTFGSSGSAMGTGVVSLPVEASSAYLAQVAGLGHATFFDASAPATFRGAVRLESTTTARPVVFTTGSTHAGEAGLSSTVPMTWASTDRLIWTMTYEAA